MGVAELGKTSVNAPFMDLPPRFMPPRFGSLRLPACRCRPFPRAARGPAPIMLYYSISYDGIAYYIMVLVVIMIYHTIS